MAAGPRIDILTLFPEMVEGFLKGSLLGSARREGVLDVRVTDVRAFATDRYRTVDDEPYGGGDGMVLRCEPCVAAVESIAEAGARILALSPRGRRLDQSLVAELAQESQISTRRVRRSCRSGIMCSREGRLRRWS